MALVNYDGVFGVFLFIQIHPWPLAHRGLLQHVLVTSLKTQLLCEPSTAADIVNPVCSCRVTLLPRIFSER